MNGNEVLHFSQDPQVYDSYSSALYLHDSGSSPTIRAVTSQTRQFMAVSCCPGFKWFNPNRSFPNVPHIFNTSLTSLLRKSPVGRLINTTWRSGPKAFCGTKDQVAWLLSLGNTRMYLLVGNLWYSHRGTKTCWVSKIETQPHGSSRSWSGLWRN